MDFNRLEQRNSNYRAAQSASKDTYMMEALKKVKESNTTIDTDLSMFNGSYLYTESQTKKGLHQSLETLECAVMEDVQSLSTKPKSIKTKPHVPSSSTNLTEKYEQGSWKLILEQVGRKRIRNDRPFGFFGNLRASLTTRDTRRIDSLKRSK